ncbi:ATP-dependent DNA helicase [Photobacterium phosphoreum]|uniref:ATP-dependent DNA helicase n=1 Tax=Photobacterium phosphoreum TaxID=659 RepID=UPI001E6047EA|nr:AAA family ATPase [Photobacterium phosphoreum]MCD9472601.1 exonuclease V subunit alpha [Photobacterium phosphoreum]
MTGNFELLEQRWPQLASFAQYAETYAYTDPQSALTKLRCFCEAIVGVLYRELALPCEPRTNLIDKLKSDEFIEVVGDDLCQKLHALRMKGNRAVHHNEGTTGNALWLIKEAYFLGQWLYKAYSSKSHESYPVFVQPKKPDSLEQLSKSREELASQLDAAKQELLSVEANEKSALDELSKLRGEVDALKLERFKVNAEQAAQSIDFEQEVTSKNISIHDSFSEYSLTAGQTELVDQLDQFLSNKDKSVFQLKGYAGTGKTFITKGLTEYFRTIGRTCVLSAPTGKAAKVISNKTGCSAYTIHKTIYSFKDLVEYRDESGEESETYKLYAQIAVNELSADTVFIIDESSMISDVYNDNEFFRCGTGKLLSDLLKFINLDHNDHRKKVIFIGDDAQLPPVGMRFSPALSAEYLKQNFELDTASYELTEVVRQKADSGVMKNSIQLRNALKAEVFNQLSLDMTFADIEEVEYVDLLPKYLESCRGKINGESIVVAGSNRDVMQYNCRIREHFFPDQPEISNGDKVIAVSNNDRYGFYISNGEFGLVRQVFGPTKIRKVVLNPKSKDKRVEIELSFREVDIGFKDLTGTSRFFRAKIMENLLYSEQPQLSSDESKALYIDFCMRHSNLRRNSLEFKETLRADPYFNALRVKFGYAITCHKAQGSEWNHVFVKCKTHQNTLSAGYFRWFYTAITRTAKQLYLLEPPKIKLGGGLKSVTTVGSGFIVPAPRSNVRETTVSSQLEGSNIDNSLVFDLSDDSTFGIPQSEAFLMQILGSVRQYLEGSGCAVVDIDHKQYHEAYTIQRANESVRINIWYNAKEKVSQVKFVEVSPFSTEVADLLTPLKLGLVNNSCEVPEVLFSQQFQNEFHQRLMELVSSAGITLSSAEEQQWALRYTFSKGNSVAVFDINFNGKQQFTKKSVLPSKCVGSELVGEIDMILTEGLS